MCKGLTKIVVFDGRGGGARDAGRELLGRPSHVLGEGDRGGAGLRRQNVAGRALRAQRGRPGFIFYNT